MVELGSCIPSSPRRGARRAGGAPAVRLPGAQARRLRGWIGAAFPAEACGLLVGREDAGAIDVRWATPARNLAAAPRQRYELDPADWLAAHEQAQRAGLEVIGVWHSHPQGDAQPSPRDLAGAWPGYVYLIAAALPGGIAELRAWQRRGDAFCECPLLS